MTNKERSNAPADEQRKPVKPHDDGVLDSLGKAIFAPIAGATKDDLLPDEDLPQRKGA